MDKPRVTPKDFFLWAGAMVALYASVIAFLSLVFDYINYAFPDVLGLSYGNPYQNGISYEMASLIVLYPVFLLLMWLVRRDIARDPTRREVWVRRWAIMFTLFVAGATMAGDLITLIMYFLNGEVTLRFILKVVIVLLVSGAGFLHFISDLWGYWEQHPMRSRAVGWGTGVLVALTIVGGFVIIGNPWQARLYRFDEQKVSDLQSLQYQIINYYQHKQALPQRLADLADPISGYQVPNDPQTNLPYSYTTTGQLSFELCAAFNAPTQEAYAQSRPTAPVPMGAKGTQDNWQHTAGEVCFDRTIDPALYPPIK